MCPLARSPRRFPIIETERAELMSERTPFRWHIAVFLAPAVVIYTLVMIIPLFATLVVFVAWHRQDCFLVYHVHAH